MPIIDIDKKLKRNLDKLYKKDKNKFETVWNKIEEIKNSSDIEHYKNLRHGMSDRKRVQIGHFVLIFKFLKNENKIIFLDLDHHDNIYKK